MKTTTPLEVLIRCPITGERMADPVVDPEGNSYERSAIIDWLTRNQTSPFTRTPLRVDQLTPNRALRDMIEAKSRNDAQESDTQSMTHHPLRLPELSVDLKTIYNEDNQALIQVRVPDNAESVQSPAAVIGVIDESYSMDNPATMHGDSEGLAGLSLLDIVKHAITTVIETLGPHDKLALVAYSDNARVVLPFLPMTPENKLAARDAVKALRTSGSTNLWDGLKQAMDLARDEDLPNSNIILLTDGLPNIHPPRGELGSLLRYKDHHPDMRCRISTFGFGYHLDSKLLNDIAFDGGGHYSFIPDSSFVGTVFINATANILATALPESTLLLEATNGAKIVKCPSGFSAKTTSWGLSVTLPNLLYGQTLDVLVDLDQSSNNNLSPFSATLKSSRIVRAGEEAVLASSVAEPSQNQVALFEIANYRAKVVGLIRTCEGRFGPRPVTSDDQNIWLAQADLKNTLEEIVSAPGSTVLDGLKGMIEDLKGQIDEAYSRLDWHWKWGRHYLPSLARAHELQQCTNFKDPGLQGYATRKFSSIRDSAEDAFCKLPPPTPSLARKRNTRYRPVRSMSAYCDSDVLCFATGNVRLSDGRFVPVSKVVAGDTVLTPDGPAKVLCVVATACDGGKEELVELEGGVLVTPWHPVRAKGTKQWKFPSDIGKVATYPCDWVYSFVLDRGACAMQIGPYEAVSLGHCIESDPVATHAYLGSSRVLDDLSNTRGWREGAIKLAPNPAVRDPQSGLIVSLNEAHESVARNMAEKAIAPVETQTQTIVACFTSQPFP